MASSCYGTCSRILKRLHPIFIILCVLIITTSASIFLLSYPFSGSSSGTSDPPALKTFFHRLTHKTFPCSRLCSCDDPSIHPLNRPPPTESTHLMPFSPSNNSIHVFPSLLELSLSVNASSMSGFIAIQDQANHSPPPAVKHFGVSMLHQLHCLDMIRDAMFPPSDRSYGDHHHNRHGGRGTDNAERTIPVSHLIHCFDYVTQGILCSADSTLEPADISTPPNSNRSIGTIDGEGVMHRCRDAKKVIETAGQSTKDRDRKPVKVEGTVEAKGGLGVLDLVSEMEG